MIVASQEHDEASPRDAAGWEVTRALRAVQSASLLARQGMARQLGVGVTDVDALDHLDGMDPPRGPVELAQRLGIRSPSATVLVDRLESAGHVIRERDELDRRRQRLTLTEHARQEAWAALEPLLTALNTIANDLTPTERQTVRDYLNRAAQALAEYGHHDLPDQAKTDRG